MIRLIVMRKLCFLILNSNKWLKEHVSTYITLKISSPFNIYFDLRFCLNMDSYMSRLVNVGISVTSTLIQNK